MRIRKNTKKRGTRKRLIPTWLIARIALCFMTSVLMIIVGALGALMIIHYGPSPAARNLFTASVTETSAAKFLATWFLPQKTIDEIMGDNLTPTADQLSDSGGVELPGDDNTDGSLDKNALEIFDIKGRTYTGKMMIVGDPTRIKIGAPSAGYGKDKTGVKTVDMVKESNAIAGVNGGGFDDSSGKGNGGVPIGRREGGIVISGGKLLWGSLRSKYEVIGLDSKGLLILGQMTGQEALDRDIKEALNFGPYLIINGEPYNVIGEMESGLNPRTVIGQRKDGAILLLVINGRQSNSLGATLDDLIEIMMEYGAVNAANLDGGSSSYMVYENEIITTCASLYGPRKMATSILVSRVKE